MNLRRLDTLGLRLFLLMWLTLVLSHFVAFAVVVPALVRPAPAAAERAQPPAQRPPGTPPDLGPPPGPRPGLPPLGTLPPAGLPPWLLLTDYAVRALIIALGAALGARWLARPVRDIRQAAEALSLQLARQQPAPRLDETRGTEEVRAMARVFNGMAARLQDQFDARGMHLASVSHDLRTPLTRLRMRLEMADPGLADAASSDIREMSEMIDTTLDVLREQLQATQPEPLDLRSLLQALADDAQDAGQAVHLAPGPEAQVLARPLALRRALGNLVANALRYGGQARLSLECGPLQVAIHVDDAGPGIPPEQLEQAFRPWVRLTTPHARAGHGLGLAIARELLERDGGRLQLANRHEGGLRASITLPCSG